MLPNWPSGYIGCSKFVFFCNLSVYKLKITNMTCQCYLIGPVHVYVAINPYSKYVYRNFSIHKSCFAAYIHISCNLNCC